MNHVSSSLTGRANTGNSTPWQGRRHKKPETTFGKVKADVLADKDPKFVRGNFCSVVRSSSWIG